ncbi:HTH domain-containing protein [Candidatus Woesearchaeota archaeon]|nr:HTH domain-containing protein [Candidatus Woesearchaeota archaeon]
MITTTQKILIALIKDFSATHTATSLAQQLKMSRWGVWKIIKKLQQEEIIVIKPTGKGKTSAQTIHLNWSNKLTEKTITLALAQESSNYQRWCFNFAELEKEADFLLLYGSVLHSPKTAGDIDILSVAKENKLSRINKLIFAIQKTQEKKIHSYNFTAKEFVQELQQPNKVFVDALNKGVVLFGQEKFVQFIKGFCK